jgi:hypothetical protein
MSTLFKTQLEEDILLIQKEWGHLDNHLKKDEYAFNYWILSRLYDLDEELIPDLITEYNDKSIDCYVHFPDSKELFIVQNKYYDENTPLARGAVSDFLLTPLVSLSENKYKRSPLLQKIYNTVKDDPEYKIFLHFYVSNDKRNLDSDSAIKNFNNTHPIKILPLLNAQLFYLEDIRCLYYGESFKEGVNFKFTLMTKVKGTTLRILPTEYDLPELSKAYFMLTPVYQLFSMYNEAIKKKYALFEDNIREYLGKNAINKGIINTLKDKEDRANFFYYNNGITMICKTVGAPSGNKLELFQPQIVNGCQTVNSIFEVLNNYPENKVEDEFKNTFVMVKVLLFDEKSANSKSINFYKDIVKYNNKQNAINENAFGARKKIFEKIQVEFKERGFLLLVKPSDKNVFLKEYAKDVDSNRLLGLANSYASKIGMHFNSVSEVLIPLEKLIQVYMAFIKDAFYAYTKKNMVLKQTSDVYKEFSLNLNRDLTHDNLIRLYLIYLKAENARKISDDRKSPIPYYFINFMGELMRNKSKLNGNIEDLFESKNVIFNSLSSYLSKLTSQYRKEYLKQEKNEYNEMIKKPINPVILNSQIETLNELIADKELMDYFNNLTN